MARVVLTVDGSFEFEAIPPGAYRVAILPETSLKPIDIRVVDRDVDVPFGLTPTVIFGTVVVDGGGPPPPFEIRFNDAATGDPRNQVPAAGGFLAEVAGGAYRLEAIGLPKGFSMTPVNINMTGPDPIQITITLGVSAPAPWVRVRGRVVSGPDSPVISAVTLDGEGAAAPMKAAVGPDGAFEFPKVLPGNYTARTTPSPVDFPRAVVVGPDGVAVLELAGPRAEDLAGEFVPIAPGEFSMGCSVNDPRCSPNEKPAHRVAVTRGFEMGKYEVTQKQWTTVMATNPSLLQGDDIPIHGVSWQDTQEFIARLNALGGEYRYRLPSEAEWEYAARAGSAERDPGPVTVPARERFRNMNAPLKPVGAQEPNAWGLFDMRGNVAEWVEDWYDIAYYSNAPALDPIGPRSGNAHVLRGGSARSEPNEALLSVRNPGPSDLAGFRLARERRP
ncbi:MAG TPA: SUMF1/EgtB/PvdO family nonheme iron enzyme [Terriglobia bacterium]|nr:SUMF1/EgtB/PvdO family nonheme iron enzyme [Terriglobia bacterium]